MELAIANCNAYSKGLNAAITTIADDDEVGELLTMDEYIAMQTSGCVEDDYVNGWTDGVTEYFFESTVI